LASLAACATAAFPDEGVPYLDSGQICEDRTVTFEEIEYDEQIHCKVAMRKKCDSDDNAPAASEDDEEEMSEACHTMYKKECRITYRPRMTKVQVRVCPNGRVKVRVTRWKETLRKIYFLGNFGGNIANTVYSTEARLSIPYCPYNSHALLIPV
jgi:hypothetical protein